MKWTHYASLKQSAKDALRKGNGKHGQFAVDGNHIAHIDPKTGRAEDWYLVIRGGGKVVTAR